MSATKIGAMMKVGGQRRKVPLDMGQRARRSLVEEGSRLLSFLSGLKPCFPSAFENEDVFQLRFFPQTSRNFAAGAAALAAAVNHHLLLRQPNRQHLRKQFIPTILIEKNSARNMFLRE